MCLRISVKSALIGDAGGEGGGCGVRATSAGEACVKTMKCECPSFPPVISQPFCFIANPIDTLPVNPPLLSSELTFLIALRTAAP
jgi:hypothetical protein